MRCRSHMATLYATRQYGGTLFNICVTSSADRKVVKIWGTDEKMFLWDKHRSETAVTDHSGFSAVDYIMTSFALHTFTTTANRKDW
jgi:hypothetical protein